MKKQEAFEKNRQLVYSLKELRKTALGIGTNKIKRRLNKLKESNPIAKALRIAIEIEDKNIQAKDSYWYKDNIYAEKHRLIIELINLFKENGWVYGKQKSDIIDTSWIIYFEIPNTEQISWHTDLDNPNDVPEYNKDWDGKINSTYYKLLDSIEENFNEIIY